MRFITMMTVSAVMFSPTMLVADPDNPPLEQLNIYRQQGVQSFDAERGRLLWNTSVNKRSCTACHGASPKDIGKHVKTGKRIEPMALSLNSQRYQNSRKIEKWFKRNCKWTLGRSCTTQEKADVLSWLASL